MGTSPESLHSSEVPKKIFGSLSQPREILCLVL